MNSGRQAAAGMEVAAAGMEVAAGVEVAAGNHTVEEGLEVDNVGDTEVDTEREDREHKG